MSGHRSPYVRFDCAILKKQREMKTRKILVKLVKEFIKIGCYLIENRIIIFRKLCYITIIFQNMKHYIAFENARNIFYSAKPKFQALLRAKKKKTFSK